MSDNQQFCLRWNNHQSTLVQVIDSLLSSGVLVDCTLAAEGQYLHAHKVVLCACSPYLETLLSQHYEKHPIVILKDVKFQELKSMMDYMYKGEVNISQDQLGQFLKAAESLQIKGLTDGGGGENDSKDVGSTSHKRHDPPPIRKSVPPNTSRSSVVLPSHGTGLTIEPSKRSLPSHLSESQPDSPIRSREGSSSPTPRKRRRPRRPSQGDDDGHQDNCDLPMQQQSMLNTVPIIPQLPAGSSSTITKAPPPDDEPDQPAESDVRLAESGLLKEKIEPQSELLIEPKTEYMEETNNDDSVEDLTLDDDDEYDNMDAAGPSHGGDNSNQSYGQWQMGDRTHDEVFMAAQEAVGGGPRDSQERDLAKAEPNDTDTSAALTLQLDNSDWSISPSSDCSLTDDSILTPVSQSDVESNDTLDDAGTSAVTIIDTETNTVLADIPVDNATIEIHSLDGDTAPGEILEVPENNREVEEEFLAVEVDKIPSTEERGPLGSINSAEKTSPSIYRFRPSVQDHVLTETAESISYQDGIANGLVDIDLSPESPLASFQQSDQCIASKPIEVIALLERDTEIDCGVEPLPDPPAELNSESSPSPVSLSPPPQQLVAPVEAMVDPISGDAPPWITKKKEAVSKAIAEAVKHGSVIIRARGKILRKSSRKKIGPKKHGQRKDCFQEYLEKAFELQPFIIKLDRYKTGSEPNESEKLNFLSNFNLKRNSVFPIYSEHAYTKYNCKSPRRESTSKVRRSNLSNKMKKVNKNPTVVIRKKKPQSLDLNKLNISRTINAVEIERLEESLFTKAIDIQKEHSYNFSEHDCQSFNDFSLRR